MAGLSRSVLSYVDCKQFLERAMEAERGARIPFRDESAAEYFRMRCNQFRMLDRGEKKKVYEPGHHMYGLSEYDILSLTIKLSTDGYYWVYAAKRKVDHEAIEEIPAEDEPQEVDFSEVKMIEGGADGDEASS